MLCQWCPHLKVQKMDTEITLLLQEADQVGECASLREWRDATIFSSQYPSDQMQIWKFVLEVFFFLVSMCTVLIFRQPPMYQSRTPSRQRGSGRATLASAASTGTDVFWWSYSPRWMPLLLP